MFSLPPARGAPQEADKDARRQHKELQTQLATGGTAGTAAGGEVGGDGGGGGGDNEVVVEAGAYTRSLFSCELKRLLWDKG